MHIACDDRAMPLGVVVTGADANDGCQTHEVLAALVVRPPPGGPDHRGRRAGPADGSGRRGVRQRPDPERAEAAGFRLQAPGRGQKRPGVGQGPAAVERCHNFFAQFGRVARRWDRSARRYLGWFQLAACVIFIRSGFVR